MRDLMLLVFGVLIGICACTLIFDTNTNTKVLYVKTDLSFSELETQSALIQKKLHKTDDKKEWLKVLY